MYGRKTLAEADVLDSQMDIGRVSTRIGVSVIHLRAVFHGIMKDFESLGGYERTGRQRSLNRLRSLLTLTIHHCSGPDESGTIRLGSGLGFV